MSTICIQNTISKVTSGASNFCRQKVRFITKVNKCTSGKDKGCHMPGRKIPRPCTARTPVLNEGHMSQTGLKKCFIPRNCEKYINFDSIGHSL